MMRAKRGEELGIYLPCTPENDMMVKLRQMERESSMFDIEFTELHTFSCSILKEATQTMPPPQSAADIVWNLYSKTAVMRQLELAMQKGGYEGPCVAWPLVPDGGAETLYAMGVNFQNARFVLTSDKTDVWSSLAEEVVCGLLANLAILYRDKTDLLYKTDIQICRAPPTPHGQLFVVSPYTHRDSWHIRIMQAAMCNAPLITFDMFVPHASESWIMIYDAAAEDGGRFVKLLGEDCGHLDDRDAALDWFYPVAATYMQIIQELDTENLSLFFGVNPETKKLMLIKLQRVYHVLQ